MKKRMFLNVKIFGMWALQILISCQAAHMFLIHAWPLKAIKFMGTLAIIVCKKVLYD